MHPCKIGPCSMIEIGKDNSNFYHYTLHKDDTGSHNESIVNNVEAL